MMDDFIRGSLSSNEEHKNLSYLFHEYLFLDRDYKISIVGKTVEDLLQYDNGFLQNQGVNLISHKDDLKSSIMIQVAKNFFEWRPYSLKARDGRRVEVEMCGIKITSNESFTIAMRIRSSRNNFPVTTSLEADKVAVWITENLRSPLFNIQTLIKQATVNKKEEEVNAYLKNMSHQAQQLDQKIRKMMRLANSIFGEK